MNFANTLTVTLVAMLSPLANAQPTPARTFHVDSTSGKDTNDGASATTAWRSLKKAGAFTFHPGDTLLLKRGSRFADALKLTVKATAGTPFVIDAYGKGATPVIDSNGHFAGIHLIDSHHVTVRNLEITADGGKTIDGSSRTLRYGVYVQTTNGATSSNITLENLAIHAIFPEKGAESDGGKETTHKGTAIAIHGSRETTFWSAATSSMEADRAPIPACTGAAAGSGRGPATAS